MANRLYEFVGSGLDFEISLGASDRLFPMAPALDFRHGRSHGNRLAGFCDYSGFWAVGLDRNRLVHGIFGDQRYCD